MNSAGKDSAKRLAEGFGAAEGVHGLHLRVPALDAVVEIEGQNADVDGLDDVLVELLEPLEFADLFFQAGVEAGVLEGDADVAGQGFEQFDIFAGEEIAADGAAQADDGDGAAVGRLPSWHAAGQIVVEVEQCGGALLVLGQMEGLLRIFEEDVGVVRGVVEVEEAEGERAPSLAVLRGARPRRASRERRPGQAQASGVLGDEDGDASHQQRARQLLDDRLEQRLEIGFGTEAAAELDERLAVVVAMAVEGAVDPALNTALEGIEDGRRHHDADKKSPLAHGLRHRL